MANIDKLIEAIQGMQRTFGRNDLSGTFDSFLSDFDKTLTKNIEEASKKEQEASNHYKDAKAHNAPQEVLDAIEKERKAYENMFFELSQKRTEDNTENVKSSLKRKALENLSGKSGYSIHNSGKGIEGFGDSLEKLGFKKLGGSFASLGGKIKGLAGPLGIVAQAANIAGAGMKMFGDNLQHQAKQQEFENQKEAVVHQRQLALTQSFGEEQQAIMGNTITKAQNEIAASSSLAVEGNSIIQNAKAASTEIGLKSLTDIAGGAFEAAAQGISIQASVNKFQKHLETQGKVLAAKNELADTQLGLKQENIGAKNASTRTNANADLTKINQLQSQETTNYWMNTANQVAGAIPVIGDIATPLLDGSKAIVEGNQALANAKLEGLNQEKKYQAQLNETRTNIRTTMEGTAADFRASAIETVANMEQQIYDAKQDAWEREEKAWLNFTQNVFNSFQKAETAAFQMGRSLNFNEAQLNMYARNLAATQESVGKWGKTMEDMAKLQTSYQETTGVNKLFSERDFNKSFANGILIGDDLVSQLNSGMEVFNTSVSDSNDMFYEMYKSVTKMGLSGKKYGKDLVNNLKLAEKYNFRGGVKGLMEMSKWAQNVRFNTSALDGMINKVQEGGLEGVIKQSAELQVLGGNFAMGSDPMAMAWESFNDPEAYAKRVNGMLSGLGVFNSKTGDVEVKGANRMIMNQAAKSLGMSVDDLMKQIRQEGRVNQIKSFVGGRFDNDQLSAIANNASYKDGQWTVNTVNGTKNITDLTAEDVASLSGEDNNGTVEENVQKMLSTAEQMKAATTTINSQLQNALWTTFQTDAKKMTQTITDEFGTNFETYKTNVQNKMGDVMEWQKKVVNILGGGDGNDTMLSAIKSVTQQLENGVVGKIAETNTKLGQMIGQLNKAFPDAHTDDVEELRKHYNDREWLTKASTNKDSEEFKIMKRLYNNFGSTMTSMGVTVKNDGKIDIKHMDDLWALEVLSRFNSNGDVGKAVLSTKQQKALTDAKLGTHGKSLVNGSIFGGNSMFGSGTTHYDNDNESPKTDTQKIAKMASVSVNSGHYSKAEDGIVAQNGSLTRIDSSDQVLAAKKDGPIDRMLDMVQPRPMQYSSYVRDNNLASSDQVLAAKKDGPIDRMLDMVQPRPMQYSSYVRDNNLASSDQVLAAKKDGPIDRMLDMVQPRPMQYSSYVRDNNLASSDQVLAAKKDGPIDRMLDMVQPRPMQYSSYVRDNNLASSDQVLVAKKDGPIEIKPLSVNINGNIQLNGTNVDFTSQMQNDPNFKEALWKLISIEVSKRADNSGRTYDPLYNRIQTLS